MKSFATNAIFKKIVTNQLRSNFFDIENGHFFCYTPSLPLYKKQRNHRKSYMVIYENIKVIESTIEVYGNMHAIKRLYYTVVSEKKGTFICELLLELIHIIAYYSKTTENQKL